MNIFKRIWINYKWRLLCLILSLAVLITLISTWKQINIDAINPTTITTISIMLFGVLFPILKEADEKNCKKHEFNKDLNRKIEKLKVVLVKHKKKEVLFFEHLIVSGISEQKVMSKARIALFLKIKCNREEKEVEKEYVELFLSNILKNRAFFFEMLNFLFRNEDEKTQDGKNSIMHFCEGFFDDEKNIFRINNKIEREISKIEREKKFSVSEKLWIEERIIFLEERIQYIDRFRIFFNEAFFKNLFSRNKIFLKVHSKWRKQVIKNCLINYLTTSQNNESNLKVLKSHIKEFEDWKTKYYSLSVEQKKGLLNAVKKEFSHYYNKVFENFVPFFEKIYKKKINGLPENWTKINFEKSKLVDLILGEERPEALWELYNFQDRSNYLWDFARVDLKHIIKWITFCKKVNGVMRMLKKIVKNPNFDENIRQKILKNMYLFQKDRIHEFEDFLNKLLFQEENKLEIENLTNNLIKKNQKDNQTTS